MTKHRLQSQELAAAATELAGKKMRAAIAKFAAIARDHDRVVIDLEARKQRPEPRAPGIVRGCVGEVRRPDGVTEYGRRAGTLSFPAGLRSRRSDQAPLAFDPRNLINENLERKTIGQEAFAWWCAAPV